MMFAKFKNIGQIKCIFVKIAKNQSGRLFTMIGDNSLKLSGNDSF